MANQSKKQVSGVRNPDRKNGKAFKSQRKLNAHYNQEQQAVINKDRKQRVGLMHMGPTSTRWEQAKRKRAERRKHLGITK